MSFPLLQYVSNIRTFSPILPTLTDGELLDLTSFIAPNASNPVPSFLKGGVDKTYLLHDLVTLDQKFREYSHDPTAPSNAWHYALGFSAHIHVLNSIYFIRLKGQELKFVNDTNKDLTVYVGHVINNSAGTATEIHMLGVIQLPAGGTRVI